MDVYGLIIVYGRIWIKIVSTQPYLTNVMYFAATTTQSALKFKVFVN